MMSNIKKKSRAPDIGDSPEKKTNNYTIYVLFCLTLVYVGKIQELLQFFSGISIGKVLIAASGCMYLFSSPKSRFSPITSFSQTKYILAILVISILCIPSSVWPGGSFEFVFSVFFKTIIFCLLIIAIPNSHSDLEKLVTALIAAAGLLSLFSIISTATGRISVTNTYDPNDLALVLVMILPLIYFSLSRVKNVFKIGLIVTIIIVLITIVKTESRGGFLGLVAVSTFIFLYEKNIKWLTKIILFIAVGATFTLTAPQSFWERMQSILTPTEDYNYSAQGGRLQIWKQGLKLMATHPIVGVGAGVYYVAEGKSHSDRGGKWSTAHNSLIQIGVELGIAGLFFFVMLSYGSFRNLNLLKDKIRGHPDLESRYTWMINSFQISLIAYCISGFFLSAAYFPLFYVIIANIAALRKILEKI